MSVRTYLVVILATLILAPQAALAKNKHKKKHVLPDYVLDAQRVLVVIHPDAGEPLTDPAANRTAREEVEKAIMAWGRFHLVLEGMPADLIFVVRRGHLAGPTIRNSPTDRPTVTRQGIDSTARVGVQVGQPPDLSRPSPADRTGPHIGEEIGPAEDTLEVYRGGIGNPADYPLDAPPVWRYTGKNALKGPEVRAVKEFEKAVKEAEKQRKKKP